jgi:hypothetical protein
MHGDMTTSSDEDKKKTKYATKTSTTSRSFLGCDTSEPVSTALSSLLLVAPFFFLFL